MINIDTDLSLAHQLDYTTLWDLKADWFEDPNIRRGGWSGVVKMSLKQADGQPFSIFIKRQENHLSRTWRHPLAGITTFQKEYENLQRFHRYHIPTQELVYFGTRTHNGNRQAVLVTKDLEGYLSLDALFSNANLTMLKNCPARQALLKQTAKVIAHLHQHRIQHNSLYPKHIFAKRIGDSWDVRLIDLEKAKRKLFKKTAVLRELASLRRQTSNWTTKEQLIFFKAYVNEPKLSAKSKKLWYQVQDRLLYRSK